MTAGRIINDAQLPADPSRPSIPLFLASGGMVGLLLGIGIALIRERTDKRVRRAADVARRDDVPVLGVLGARADGVYPPLSAGGRTFNRLRNEVLASLADGDRVVVVTGASPGLAATLVAANLAAALARSGAEVVLVCADPAAEPAAMLGVAPAPGLSDVLAGKVALDKAIQPGRNMRVLAPGGAASAGGLLQSQALGATLERLREQARYVVVEAPSAAASADAQSLASLADAAIVAVELRRTRHAEVVDAAEQLRRVGTPLLGAVVFPRLRRHGGTPTKAPDLDRPADSTVVFARIGEKAKG
ncbi:MAG: hypothetical protein AUI14_00995 [Actinobacteria bacterium 13_2_20CM_2_71_6]|nr:MAG: hypothetical protein AUI14_00995 [Actinobacteria bacterium 13_2_20CM_2_71_6]